MIKPRLKKRNWVWICESRKHPTSSEVAIGFGSTPFHAYREWARDMPKPGQIIILDGKPRAWSFWARLFGSRGEE